MSWFKDSSTPKSEIKLERIARDPVYGIYRTPVPNGWLVVASSIHSIAMTFVPDSENKWEIKAEESK